MGTWGERKCQPEEEGRRGERPKWDEWTVLQEILNGKLTDKTGQGSWQIKMTCCGGKRDQLMRYRPHPASGGRSIGETATRG